LVLGTYLHKKNLRPKKKKRIKDYTQPKVGGRRVSLFKGVHFRAKARKAKGIRYLGSLIAN